MYSSRQNAERLKRRTGVMALALLDIAAMVLAFKLAIYLRTSIFPEFYASFPRHQPSADIFRFWWFFAIWLFFFIYEGLYSEVMPYWDEVRKVATASALATVGVFVVVSIGKLSGDVSRTVTVSMGVMLIFIYPFVRIQIKALLRMAGLLTRRVLILGAGKTGHLILTTMRKEPNLGYKVVGFLDDNPLLHGEIIDGVKVRGPISHAERYIRQGCISDVVIAMPGADGKFHQELINRLQYKAEHILFVPDLFGMAVLGITVQHFFNEQAFALQMKNNLAQPLNSFLKLVLDYTLSAVVLAASALPMVAMALAIKLTSRGPVLYTHERMGRSCVPFQCIKFRTMYSDADQRLEQILESDPDARKEWENKHKLTNDPRITPVGRLLRKTSMDELPQLFNVLKGDMSLIGPRPVTAREIDDYYKDMAKHCFQVLPGITGLWQVSGRSNTSYEYRIALDSWYVRNWNPWLDIVILFKTVRVVLLREGAG